MNIKTIPSYLFLSRHGIYYFRARIPLRIKIKYNSSKNEVRRSLSTGNRQEALQQSRRMWVSCVDSDYFLNGFGMRKQTDKYDRILEIKGTLDSLREDIGSIDEGTKILFMDNYILRLGDDIDILNEVMHQLTDEEKKFLKGKAGFEKANLILKLKLRAGQNLVGENGNDIGNSSLGKSTKYLSVVVDEYMDEYVNNSELSNKLVPEQTQKEYKGKYKLFVRIVGDMQCVELTTDKVKEYINTTRKLPVGISNSKYKGKSISKILRLNISHTKSPGTIRKEFMLIKKFLKWGAVNQRLKLTP